MRSICQLLWMQELENHLRLVKQWKWEQQQLWQIRQLQQQGIYLIWQRLLSLQFRLAEKHILLEWEEFLQEVEAHQIR